MAIDLVARRLERLEGQARETNETLARVADILDAHSLHFERMEEALIGMSERMDRLTAAIARGRTRDLARLDDHDRRLHRLETRRRRRR